MKNILKTEKYVEVPPFVKSSPDYRIAYAKKEAIRAHKWIEAEKGRNLTWEEAKNEWLKKYENEFDEYFKEIYQLMDRKIYDSPEFRKENEKMFTKFLVGFSILGILLILFFI